MGGRFHERPKRLERRAERDMFAKFFSPIGLLCLGFSALALLMAGIVYLSTGAFPPGSLPMALAILAIPLIVVLIRFARGHFNRSLDEP